MKKMSILVFCKRVQFNDIFKNKNKRKIFSYSLSPLYFQKYMKIKVFTRTTPVVWCETPCDLTVLT